MRPLESVRIVLTRAAHQADELAQVLRDLGAQILLLPVIAIAPPADLEPLRQAAANCDHYDWIIFTSANAVRAFAAELPHPPGNCKSRIAVVGAATRDAAEQQGFQVTLVPKTFIAESLIDSFRTEDLRNSRILIPSAAVTRDILPVELRNLGAGVEVVEAYRNVIPTELAQNACRIFQEPFPDWIIFASPSAVHNLASIVGIERISPVKIATIGPITSAAVRKNGLSVAVEAEVQSVSGLVEGIRAAYERVPL